MRHPLRDEDADPLSRASRAKKTIRAAQFARRRAATGGRPLGAVGPALPSAQIDGTLRSRHP
eukprot:4244235-Pyramimonas_sp.AAC.1